MAKEESRCFWKTNPKLGEPSCATWVKALPRRMVLQPRQRQAIRLLARPPAGLPDGEYWSRVIVSSEKAAEPRKLDHSEGVQVGLALATRTIISLNYRKGKVNTGVDLRHMRAQVDSAAVHLDLDLHRTGNAAWLGQVDAVLSDASGREVQRWNRALAVYEDLQRKPGTSSRQSSPPRSLHHLAPTGYRTRRPTARGNSPLSRSGTEHGPRLREKCSARVRRMR